MVRASGGSVTYAPVERVRNPPWVNAYEMKCLSYVAKMKHDVTYSIINVLSVRISIVYE